VGGRSFGYSSGNVVDFGQVAQRTAARSHAGSGFAAEPCGGCKRDLAHSRGRLQSHPPSEPVPVCARRAVGSSTLVHSSTRRQRPLVLEHKRPRGSNWCRAGRGERTLGCELEALGVLEQTSPCGRQFDPDSCCSRCRERPLSRRQWGAFAVPLVAERDARAFPGPGITGFPISGRPAVSTCGGSRSRGPLVAAVAGAGAGFRHARAPSSAEYRPMRRGAAPRPRRTSPPIVRIRPHVSRAPASYSRVCGGSIRPWWWCPAGLRSEVRLAPSRASI
jgi:hypothetical protein